MVMRLLTTEVCDTMDRAAYDRSDQQGFTLQ